MRRVIEEVATGKGASLSIDEIATFTELVRRKYPNGSIDVKVRVSLGGRIRSMMARVALDE